MSTTRLAAIMFTDIVGYTAMMQGDRAEAMAAVKLHESSLAERLSLHGGELINTYGDGSLSLFDSASAAVQCAQEIQLALGERVPLRIGIHIGEVTRDEDHTFGDGVNIASRIESMGVAGAVLFSKEVYDKVQNLNLFEVQSLGKFAFKNVAEPMEIFALANAGLSVPRSGEMKGKGEKISTNTNPLKLLIRLGSMGFIAMMIGASLFWFFASKSASGDETMALPNDLKEARIAVLPYGNQTNQADLDVLGNMASDWISRSLMELEDVKVAQFENVKAHAALLADKPKRFARQTGAEYLIKGSYYLTGKELHFESKIVNPITAEILFVLPPISGPSEQPSVLVDQLSQRITGYFAESNFNPNSVTEAPTYEAYQAFEKAMGEFGGRKRRELLYLRDAIKLDTTYLRAHLMLGTAYGNKNKWEQVDSVYQLILTRFPRRSKMENARLARFKAILDGDLEKQYGFTRSAWEKDPLNFYANYSAGYEAFSSNRSEAAMEIFSQLEADSIELDIPIKYYWFGHYGEALVRLERYEEALELLRIVPFSKDGFYKIRRPIFINTGQLDSLEYIRSVVKEVYPAKTYWSWLGQIPYEYALKGDRDQQLAWSKQLIDSLQSSPFRLELASAYFVGEQYEKALEIYLELLETRQITAIVISRIAYLYASMGEAEKAGAFLAKFAPEQFPRGQKSYFDAMVWAASGKKGKAVSSLKSAYKAGFHWKSNRYNGAIEFMSLRGYPPFDDFVSPK